MIGHPAAIMLKTRVKLLTIHHLVNLCRECPSFSPVTNFYLGLPMENFNKEVAPYLTIRSAKSFILWVCSKLVIFIALRSFPITVSNSLTTQSRLLMTLKKKSFGNIVGKGKNAGN